MYSERRNNADLYFWMNEMNNLTPELAIVLLSALSGNVVNQPVQQKPSMMIGKKVIIRTYSAGVHYGTLIEKEGEEVILENSRRLHYWKTTNKGISLSEVAMTGLASDSRVCEVLPLLWLKAIEIIPCSEIAQKNIENQNVYTS